jgi:hypothetical protein
LGFRGPAGPRVSRGVKDADLFAGSVPLMEATATLLDFGRVDVLKDNGPWFDNGVTHNGLAAIKAMEANNIVPNLVDPSPKLLGDVLDAATKPFMVTLTGAAALDPALVSQMNRKDVLMAVECKPADVQGCASRLEDARKQFADFDNLLLSMNASGDIDEARKSLYMALIRGGWTKDQIYAMTGGAAAGGRPGGNLARMAPRP